MKHGFLLMILPLLVLVGCTEDTDPFPEELLEGSPPSDSQNGWGGHDPGPPDKLLKIVFVHHSCGKNLLEEGLGDLLGENNYRIRSITYGDEWFGDHTTPSDFPVTFGKYLDEVSRWKLPPNENHDIIMFKSCYPASAISSDEMIEQYKEWYRMLLPIFKSHPGILFVAFSPPPLHPKATSKKEALRAHRFANWLKTEFANSAKNVASFDFFNFLSDPEVHTLRFKYRRSPSETLKRLSLLRRTKTRIRRFFVKRDWDFDSHPNTQGNKEAASAFIPWINRAVRKSGLVEK